MACASRLGVRLISSGADPTSRSVLQQRITPLFFEVCHEYMNYTTPTVLYRGFRDQSYAGPAATRVSFTPTRCVTAHELRSFLDRDKQ